MIVCICRAVSDREIRSLVDNGATSMTEVRAACGVGECCGKCARQAREVIAERLATIVVQEASRPMNVC
jgi:bacterioferritin-associated ferredoxin